MHRKSLSVTGSVRVDPGDGRLVLVPDEESALLLKHAADIRFSITLHCHDRAAALKADGKADEAKVTEKQDASIKQAVKDMLAKKEEANLPVVEAEAK